MQKHAQRLARLAKLMKGWQIRVGDTLELPAEKYSRSKLT